MGVFLAPVPGGPDDFFERGVGGFPAEGAFEFFFAGNENGGIARAARTEFAGNLEAGNTFCGGDDFEDGEAAAVANVEGFTGNAVDLLKSAEVGIGDIEDVDVIADAGSVWGGVIGAENINVRINAAGSVENTRNDVSLDAMMLAAFF